VKILAVQKECQRVIHFVAYNEVYHKGIEEPLSDEQKKEVIYCIVHEGNTRSVESMSLLLYLKTRITTTR
jgi:hypothetical protein